MQQGTGSSSFKWHIWKFIGLKMYVYFTLLWLEISSISSRRLPKWDICTFFHHWAWTFSKGPLEYFRYILYFLLAWSFSWILEKGQTFLWQSFHNSIAFLVGYMPCPTHLLARVRHDVYTCHTSLCHDRYSHIC